MTKYEVEPSCRIFETVIEAIDAISKEEQYPTLKAIFTKRCGHPMDDYDYKNVNRPIFRLASGYQGIEVKE